MLTSNQSTGIANKNARIGMEAERLFKNSIRNRPEVLETLKAHFGINGTFATSYKTGTDAGKTDVILSFSDGRTLKANIKAFDTGFNQVTRSRIAIFCEHFPVAELQTVFEDAAVRIASNRRNKFILEEDRDRVSAVMSPLSRRILQHSLSRLENPELLVLYDRPARLMYLFDLQSVLDVLDCEISFSKKGIIRIGEYFTIQRKGGDGGSKRHEKTSILHPGNGLQVKMKSRKFIAENEPILTFKV
jgi:hypothetical protein